MIDSPALNKFLDDLIIQKHGVDVAAAVREQLRIELAPRLEKWLILSAMQAIGDKSAEDLKTFEDLAQGDTPPQKILEFIQSHIPDSDVFFANAMIQFSQVYLHPETASV